MKRNYLFMLVAAALTRAVVASPDVTLRVAPERDLVYTGGAREVIVQVDLDAKKPERGAKRAPMNLAVVLDRSGSMQGAKIEKAKQGACVAIDKLADDDFFSLVMFDNDAEVLLAPERVGGERSRDALKSRIDRVRPGGGTAIHAGVTLGAIQLRKYLEREFVNRVVLLSDGLANVGPSRAGDLASLGRELRREGMSVTTIGLGDDYNEDLMTALAEASHANYYYVRDAEKLPGIFAEELGAAWTLVARGITIRITVPDGVRIREIVGLPEIKCGGQSADIALPEYFGGDKRRFLVRCAVEAKRTEPIEVAAVDLKYEAVSGEKAEPQKQAANVRFTDEADKSEGSQRAEIAREVSIVENRLSKARAVKLADEGNSKDAARVLRDQAEQNAAAPAKAQLPGLAAENRRLEEAAREVESQGQLGKATRKQVQYENWQDKYQKR